MRLASVRPGDIVRVDDGMPYYGEVIEVLSGGRALAQRAGVRVSPITGPRGVRGVSARQVVGHWRRVGREVKS